MKKLNLVLSVLVMFVVASCSCTKEESKQQVVETPKKETDVKRFINKTTNINTFDGGQEVYYNALFDATSVDLKIEVVNHIRTTEVIYLDVRPVVVTYTDGQNTATFRLPQNYLVQKYVKDEFNTVWIYGFANGKFKEYVFFAQKRFNNKKILPNSYWGEHGTIKYLDIPVAGI